jgi:hypothetical protein
MALVGSNCNGGKASAAQRSAASHPRLVAKAICLVTAAWGLVGPAMIADITATVSWSTTAGYAASKGNNLLLLRRHRSPAKTARQKEKETTRAKAKERPHRKVRSGLGATPRYSAEPQR